MGSARHINNSPRVIKCSEFPSLFGAVWTCWIFELPHCIQESQMTAGIFPLCPALLHVLVFAVLSGNCSHSVFCSDTSRAEQTYAVLTGKGLLELFLKLGKKITAAEEECLPLRGVCSLRARTAMYHSGLWFHPHLKSSTGFIALPITLLSRPLSLDTGAALAALPRSHLNLSSLVQLWMFCGLMKKLSMSTPLCTSFWSLLCVLTKTSFIPPLLPAPHVVTHYCSEFSWKTATGMLVTPGQLNLWSILYLQAMARCIIGKLSLQLFYQWTVCSGHLERCTRTWKQVTVLITQISQIWMEEITRKRSTLRLTEMSLKGSESDSKWTLKSLQLSKWPLKVSSCPVFVFTWAQVFLNLKKAAASDLAGNREKRNRNSNCFKHHIWWCGLWQHIVFLSSLVCVVLKSLSINKAICLFWTAVALI